MRIERDEAELPVLDRAIVAKLLAERQDMLVQFCKLAGLEPYTADQRLLDGLQKFCQVLMDYTAFGHFEVLAKVVADRHLPAPVLEVAQQVYSGIAETTEQAVAFNDKYDPSDHELDLDELPQDLSALGEHLAARVELEDRVLSRILEN